MEAEFNGCRFPILFYNRLSSHESASFFLLHVDCPASLPGTCGVSRIPHRTLEWYVAKRIDGASGTAAGEDPASGFTDLPCLVCRPLCQSRAVRVSGDVDTCPGNIVDVPITDSAAVAGNVPDECRCDAAFVQCQFYRKTRCGDFPDESIIQSDIALRRSIRSAAERYNSTNHSLCLMFSSDPTPQPCHRFNVVMS